MKSASNNLVGLDNYTRPAEQETELNSLFLNVLNTKNGQKLMNYLKSITIEAVAGSEVSDATLRHLEGQRYMVGLIQRRINKGKSQNIVQEKLNVK
tara:strand:+ start:1670 stop:1957 length:288 start_codon:yes stop_codon:yes gene_type:complete